MVEPGTNGQLCAIHVDIWVCGMGCGGDHVRGSVGGCNYKIATINFYEGFKVHSRE